MKKKLAILFLLIPTALFTQTNLIKNGAFTTDTNDDGLGDYWLKSNQSNITQIVYEVQYVHTDYNPCYSLGIFQRLDSIGEAGTYQFDFDLMATNSICPTVFLLSYLEPRLVLDTIPMTTYSHFSYVFTTDIEFESIGFIGFLGNIDLHLDNVKLYRLSYLSINENKDISNNDLPIQYYTLYGQELQRKDLKRGLYVQRQGKVVKKIYIQ